jgi:hypothetical protein
VTTGYRRLAAKHDAFVEKVKQEKAKLAEPHAAEVAKLIGDLDLEMRSYIKYHLTMRRRLREVHEIVASSFDEVQVWCLPFPDKGAKVEEMIDWVVGEVKAVSDTVWWLSDNFTILGIEGVLNMLNGEGCQELGRPCHIPRCCCDGRCSRRHAQVGGVDQAPRTTTVGHCDN